MNPQWQRQQKQQQEYQRRMQQAAWQQQKEREKQMAAKASPSSVSHLEERFAKVEREADRLRSEFKAGRISAEAFQAKLQELLVQDYSGTWWMVGSESGRWYKHDGRNWVPGTPPMGRSPRSQTVSHGASAQTIFREGSAFKGILVFVFGLAISGALFFGAGSGSYNLLSETSYDIAEPASFVIAGVVGLLGLVITIRKAREVWRGY
jgi:hypothetical protein